MKLNTNSLIVLSILTLASTNTSAIESAASSTVNSKEQQDVLLVKDKNVELSTIHERRPPALLDSIRKYFSELFKG
jgi:hypothetical protein